MDYPKQTKTIDLSSYGLLEVPASKRREVKEEVAEFITNEIQLFLADGKSPVSKESFKRLSKEYAQREKDGDRTPDLNLEGDLWQSIDAQLRKGSQIEVGIFKKSEQGKADGHNNFSGKSAMQRRFIPSQDQKFVKSIETGISQIIKQAQRKQTPRQEQSRDLEQSSRVQSEFTFEELFGSNFDGLI